MKRTLAFALLAPSALVLFGSNSNSAPAFENAAVTKVGESLTNAVARVNAEVQRDYGVLSPTRLTVTKLKLAIRKKSSQIAKGDWHGRESYVKVLESILETDQLPETDGFCFIPTRLQRTAQDNGKNPDHVHVSYNLNYALIVKSQHGNRVIGLPDLREAFHVSKPPE